MRTIRAVDLFCGAGGTSTGLVHACTELGYRLALTAINHWPVAVETHAANHGFARHLCASLEGLEPSDAHSGRLDLLLASPACTHHSNARGGKPRSAQSRASAWHVVYWAEQLRPAAVIVENVPEFAAWGPLDADGKRIVAEAGETYRAWRKALESLGYDVEARVLNSADYGEAQSRRRLFVQARLDTAPTWPEASHLPFSGGRKPAWRPAREIVDFSLPMGCVTELCHRTLDRIEVGMGKFGVTADFLVQYYGTSTVASLDAPLPTVTTKDRFGLASGTGFRMLQPSELAAAMGFPASYRFAGTKTDQVKQIGNAVSVRTAKALCEEVLR